MLNLIFIFICFMGLVVLHEFGHFILAKKFGVKVEEFGIGFPPRIVGKKIGETIYSLNLLPLGAFVRLPGEIERLDDPRSFSQQSLLKRALIIAGGVISFWIIAAVLFSVVFGLGVRIVVEDKSYPNFRDPKVQIAFVSSGSPAQLTGLQPGDTIKKMLAPRDGEELFPDNEQDVIIFTNSHLRQKIILTLERQGKTFDVALVPRMFPPANDGPMGIFPIKTAFVRYPWYLASFQGISATISQTLAIIEGYGQAITNIIRGESSGVELVGPVGVVSLLSRAINEGVSYFFNFLALISIYLAIFNILPIPAVDGGKLLFLGIEAVRKRPVDPKIEQRITAVFFSLLLALMIWVSIKDILKIF